ncbi:MAG TPA: hypothetical protein VI365_29120, partial [Trebonia sp.]
AAEFDVSYPESSADAVRNASQLWLIDLGDPGALQRGKADDRVWNDASLRWLVDPGQMPDEPARGVRIGLSDVERFRATVDMFARLDDLYGGGHARQALVQYLSADAGRMLNGRYNDAVGVPIQDISDTVGHKSTHVTETVYRHVIVPQIRGGAAVMDNVFGDEDGDDEENRDIA